VLSLGSRELTEFQTHPGAHDVFESVDIGLCDGIVGILGRIVEDTSNQQHELPHLKFEELSGGRRFKILRSSYYLSHKIQQGCT
jgi:hypothetical protein